MRKRKNKKGLLIGGIAAGVVVILAGGGVFAWKLLINTTTPQETVKNYFALVEKKQYDKMYDMLSESSKEKISKKKFTERNQNIYEGIEVKDIKISIPEKEKLKGSPVTVKYSETMETSADEISFDNAVRMEEFWTRWRNEYADGNDGQCLSDAAAWRAGCGRDFGAL